MDISLGPNRYLCIPGRLLTLRALLCSYRSQFQVQICEYTGVAFLACRQILFRDQKELLHAKVKHNL